NCSKDDIIKPQTELPPITQTGENTVGCLVDGEVFLPKGSNPLGNPVLTCFYQFVNGQWHFSLGFSNNKKEHLRAINIASHNINFEEGKSYNLVFDDGNNAFGRYTIYKNGTGYDYRTSNEIKGKLTINKLDQNKAIISGTFWFDAVNSNGENVEIREGRFDMQYTV
ncbi:DUF6252 family protein, partial [Tenacibaculum sp. TC6]|uniref:DUF6252 family protein n=1 Tax=Tenacibaculum sp. TC6 TaxID=3423223 RepID=UPI003D364443